MEWLNDPAAWLGLLTLIILEIVLGIDNLIFIAIVADKLPPEQRDKARLIGLSLALIMRLILLGFLSQLMQLKTPIIQWQSFSVSGRDLILLCGGIFLLWKATTELHERLEGIEEFSNKQEQVYSKFGLVLLQIVILDAVFSLDSIITAIGMVDHLQVMMLAVIIAMALMMIGSKPLTKFVNSHPTVVMLCLSFLLMIGFSLIVEGLGFKVPKAYLYVAIGFSIMIEFFNQLQQRNLKLNEEKLPIRVRTAKAILKLIANKEQIKTELTKSDFGKNQSQMLSGVLNLSDRKVLSIMTPRSNIEWLNFDSNLITLKQDLLNIKSTLIPICEDNLDNILGVAKTRDLLAELIKNNSINKKNIRPAMLVSENLGVLELSEKLRQSRNHLALVINEHKNILGLITPIDLLEAIAGEFPDENEVPEIQIIEAGKHWIANGIADLHALENLTGIYTFLETEERFSTLSGFLLHHLEEFPKPGQILITDNLRFEVLRIHNRKIISIDIKLIKIQL